MLTSLLDIYSQFLHLNVITEIKVCRPKIKITELKFVIPPIPEYGIKTNVA